MDYYYGSYGCFKNWQPLLPLNYDNWTEFNENSDAKWGALAKIILQNNPETCQDLLKSVTGDIYARLKDLSFSIQKPKFQKVLKLIDELLQKEMESWSEHFQITNETEEQKQLRSWITLLLLLKKGKLEEVVAAVQSQKHRRLLTQDRITKKELSFWKFNPFPVEVNKFSRYFQKPNFRKNIRKMKFKSEKVVPSLPRISIINNGDQQLDVWKKKNKKFVGRYERKEMKRFHNTSSGQVTLNSLTNDEIERVSNQIPHVRVLSSIRRTSISDVNSLFEVPYSRNINQPQKSLSSVSDKSQKNFLTPPCSINQNIPLRRMRKITGRPHWKSLSKYI